LLQAVDSPFIKNTAPEWRDLALAVAICQTRYDQTPKKKPGLFPFWWLPALLFPGWLKRQIGSFYKYSGDYLSSPDFAVIESPSQKSSRSVDRGLPPALLQKACDIIGWSHWSEAYVWEMPLCKVDWYQVMIAKAAGMDVDFLTEEGRQEQAELRVELDKKESEDQHEAEE